RPRRGPGGPKLGAGIDRTRNRTANRARAVVVHGRPGNLEERCRPRRASGLLGSGSWGAAWLVAFSTGATRSPCGTGRRRWPRGAGSQIKLLGNNLIAHMLVGLAQGIAVARESGIDPKLLIDVVQGSGFASAYFPFKGTPMIQRDFETHFSLDLLHKDLLLLV